MPRRLPEPSHACCRPATHDSMFWRRLHALSENSVVYGLQPAPRETVGDGQPPKPLNRCQWSPERVKKASLCKRGFLANVPRRLPPLYHMVQSSSCCPLLLLQLDAHVMLLAQHLGLRFSRPSHLPPRPAFDALACSCRIIVKCMLNLRASFEVDVTPQPHIEQRIQRRVLFLSTRLRARQVLICPASPDQSGAGTRRKLCSRAAGRH